MKTHYILLVLAAGLLSGCANPYTKFYTDYTHGIDVLSDSRFVQSTSSPEIVHGTSPLEDKKMMFRKGYGCLGTSSFNGATVNPQYALSQAIKIHADIVLVYSDYTETLSGNMAMTLPDTQTSTSYMNGSVYGSGGGYASYSGTAVTTTHGTRTEYIPYNVQRYDYFASYWKKMKMPSLGVTMNNLSDEAIKALESHKGAEVTIVVENSPAFNNDIIEGDIISEINGTTIQNAQQAQQLLSEQKGKLTKFKIFRNGRYLDKEITLNK